MKDHSPYFMCQVSATGMKVPKEQKHKVEQAATIRRQCHDGG
jgi:hypothetical protein